MRNLIAALFALLLAAPATAQQFPTVHDHTVIGRLGTGSGSGPSQEIPFATLFANLISASGVPNAVLVTDGSGNGTFSTTLPSGLIIPSPNLTGSIKSPFGANLPIFGGGNGVALLAGTATGNTTKVATANGSFVATNCLTTDVNHNIVDNGVPCGTGTNTSTSQDFLAGTNFTAGTTTSLTVSSTPISAANSVVTFDGVVQSHNTWTLLGSTFTFSAAIPLNTQVVEIGWLSTTVLPTFVTSLGGQNGAIALGTNLSMVGSTLTATIPAPSSSVDNFLPNVQWQLWSGVTFVQETNAAGTAAQASLSCSGFGTATQGPLFSCANTQSIRSGDIVIVNNIVNFWGFTGLGYPNCSQVSCTNGLVTAARVTNVVVNTNISVASPGFGGVSPAAPAAATLSPITPGEGGVGGTNGADGWIKSGTLYASVDTWGASATPASTAYPGCERPLLLRKGVTGQEIYEWNVPPQMLKRFQGQTVTFGAAVYQRIQGGASTFNLHIDDGVGSAASATGTGASLGGYQFISVTRTVAQNATALAIYFNLLGNSGDVFDVCLPTAAFVPSLLQSQLHQNSYELIKANSHWNPPLLTPFLITFPGTNIGCPGLYGWNSIDLEAISFGTLHNTVQFVWGDVEWATNSVTTPANPSTMFFGGFVNCANGALTFGLKASTAVNGTTLSTPMSRIPLYHDGTVAMYEGVAGLVPVNGTFDFTDVEVNAGNPLQ